MNCYNFLTLSRQALLITFISSLSMLIYSQETEPKTPLIAPKSTIANQEEPAKGKRPRNSSVIPPAPSKKRPAPDTATKTAAAPTTNANNPTDSDIDPTSLNPEAQEEAPPTKKPSLFDRKKDENLVPFAFERKELVSIIDMLAAKKKVNVLLPQQAADLELLKRQTVTFQPQVTLPTASGKREISIGDAWKYLTTFLELSGFALTKKGDALYTIVRVGRPDEAGVNREILPLYVNVQPSELPHSDERIRYIYYLRNLKIPTQEDRDTNPIARIFRDMLSPNAPVLYEPKANGFIITDRANIIASAMKIIAELDQSGFRETIEVMPIRYIPAREIVKVFDSLKKAAGETAERPISPYIRSEARADSLSYFAGDTKLISDDIHNNLIIMGRQTAVERINDFVATYMDRPPESGNSILHHYDLQYLDAQEFAKVLTNIVTPPQTAGGFQATQTAVGGPERYFQGVVVFAEEVKQVETKATTEEITLEAKGGYTPTGIGAQQIITGGNRLIIAAIQEDWVRLEDFIKALDKPQPQVILEVLIIDVRGTKQHLVAGTIRSKTDMSWPDGVQFLSSNISNVNAVLGPTPRQLAQDLLGVIAGDPANPPVTSLLASGSTIISFNDPQTPGIFGLLQLLDQMLTSKVLAHPYLVTTNNQKATIASQEVRRVQGDAVPGAAGVITIEIIDLSATLQVQMIPRLSSLERLSLQVAVDINQFIDVTSNTRVTRRVSTNANMGSGQILVIGGLTRNDQIDVKTGTPFLQNIPLLGAFFGGKNKTVIKSNLAILIAPTIVSPKLRGGLDVYTADKIRKGRRDIDDNAIFSDKKDPITHLFFRSTEGPDSLMRDYLSEVTNPPDAALMDASRKRRNARRNARAAAQKAKQAPKNQGPTRSEATAGIEATGAPVNGTTTNKQVALDGTLKEIPA